MEHSTSQTDIDMIVFGHSAPYTEILAFSSTTTNSFRRKSFLPFFSPLNSDYAFDQVQRVWFHVNLRLCSAVHNHRNWNWRNYCEMNFPTIRLNCSFSYWRWCVDYLMERTICFSISFVWHHSLKWRKKSPNYEFVLNKIHFINPTLSCYSTVMLLLWCL